MPAALAAVMTGPGRTELHELPLPTLSEDDGLLRVEICGVSEADPILFRRGDIAPVILGHEIVGTIERLGSVAARRWKVREGDRVVLQEYIACGACRWCASGEYRLCASAQPNAPGFLRYGMTGTNTPPALWGGFAEYLYLHPHSILHTVPASLPSSRAALCLPLANAVQSVQLEPALTPGKTVLIFGAGLIGLCAVAAARRADAREIILCGVTREETRFAQARGLGAHHTLCADADGFAEAIAEATKGAGADIVIDTTADTSGRVAATAIASAAVGATLVLGGIGAIPLNMGEIRRKYLGLRPVRGHGSEAVARALALLADAPPGIEKLAGKRFSLSEADAALRAGDDAVSPDILRAELHPRM